MIPRLFDQPHYSAWYAYDPVTPGPRAATQAAWADREIGVTFWVTSIGAEIHGVRLYTAKAGSHTIRLKLYKPGSTTPVRNEDFAFSGPGLYTCYWTAGAYLVTVADLGSQSNSQLNLWQIGMYDPDLTAHTYAGNLFMFEDNALHAFPAWFRVNDQADGRLSVAGEGRPTQFSIGAGQCTEPLILPAESNYEPTPRVALFNGSQTDIQLETGNDRTIGALFRVGCPCEIRGVRFYNHNATPRNFKVSIWTPSGTLKDSKVSASALGQGYHDVMFDTPIAPSDAERGETANDNRWIVGVYETTNGHHTTIDALGAAPVGWSGWRWGAGAAYHMRGSELQDGVYAAGDARPTTGYGGSRNIPIDALLTPDSWGV